MMLMAAPPASVTVHHHQHLHATQHTSVSALAVQLGTDAACASVQTAASAPQAPRDVGMPPMSVGFEASASASANGSESAGRLPTMGAPTPMLVVPQQQVVESPELARERALASQVSFGSLCVRLFLTLTTTCSLLFRSNFLALWSIKCIMKLAHLASQHHTSEYARYKHGPLGMEHRFPNSKSVH